MVPLPCQVRPLPGETPAGLLGRLAAANALRADVLARYIGRELGLTTTNFANARFVMGIERVGGLVRGHFERERPSLRILRRCHHHGWVLQRCSKCDVVDLPRRACLVCSMGVPTETVKRGGLFCIRHSRWHFQDQDVLIRPAQANRRAEQVLSGCLWNRGVTMHTGEIALARRLIRDSFSEAPKARISEAGLYGPMVELTLTLTDPAVASGLITHRDDKDRQTEALIGLAIGAGGGVRTRDLERTAALVISAHRSGLFEAMRMPRSPGTKSRTVRFEKGIVEASYRCKAVLLRHVSDVRVRVAEEEGPVRGAARSRTVSRRIVPGWAVSGPQQTDVSALTASAASKIGGVSRNQIRQ